MGEQPRVSSIKEIMQAEPIFYSGIAGNTLLFHGTRSQQQLQNILTHGLKPPDEAFSRDTLARRISFCDAERYVGLGDGSIIGFKPHKSEVSPKHPHFARTQRISDNIDRLPPNRAIFYIPGDSRFPRTLFNSIEEVVSDYYMHGFNNESLIDSLRDMIVMAQGQLTQEAVFVSKDKIDTHQLAQELVWNELCGRLTVDYDNVKYYATVIKQLRETSDISSTEQLVKSIYEDDDFATFEPQTYLNLVKFLSTVHTIKGLGYEDIPYHLDENVLATTDWIRMLPETLERIPSKSPKDILFSLFKKPRG